jgi:DNA ligase (NAD+)
LIVAHGGKNSGSISGKTSYLLAGEKAGPEKLKKAEALGVKVIREAEFMNMISITGNNNPEIQLEPEQITEEHHDGEQLSLF